MNEAFHLISVAFYENKSIIERTNAALGVFPGIFMIQPIDSPKAILFHHFNESKMMYTKTTVCSVGMNYL
jgi:hypothetical protein